MLLIRNNFADYFTEGRLISISLSRELFTLEQEWRPTFEHKGGMNNNSCVPNGKYILREHFRPSGKRVLLLINPDLDVYPFACDKAGRFLIEMHAGNRPEHCKGCILPGLRRETARVWDSALAMRLILEAFDRGDNQLTIKSFETG